MGFTEQTLNFLSKWNSPKFTPVLTNGYNSQRGSFLRTSVGTKAHSRPRRPCIFVPSIKMLEKWSVNCINPESTSVRLPGSVFTRVRSEQKWSITAISRYGSNTLLDWSCLILTFQPWQYLHDPVGDELIFILRPLSYRRNVTSLSLPYRYFHECSDEYFLRSTNSAAPPAMYSPSFPLYSIVKAYV